MPRQRPTHRLRRHLCVQTLTARAVNTMVCRRLCLRRTPSLVNEDGNQDGVPSAGLVYRGHAFVDALMHLLAPALILPPIPTSPHVATLE